MVGVTNGLVVAGPLLTGIFGVGVGVGFNPGVGVSVGSGLDVGAEPGTGLLSIDSFL